jgi:hypothetical protein
MRFRDMLSHRNIGGHKQWPAIGQAANCWLLTAEARFSARVVHVDSLWWMKWHWIMFLVIYCQLLLRQCCILTCHQGQAQ